MFGMYQILSCCVFMLLIFLTKGNYRNFLGFPSWARKNITSNVFTSPDVIIFLTKWSRIQSIKKSGLTDIKTSSVVKNWFYLFNKIQLMCQMNIDGFVLISSLIPTAMDAFIINFVFFLTFRKVFRRCKWWLIAQ